MHVLLSALVHVVRTREEKGSHPFCRGVACVCVCVYSTLFSGTRTCSVRTRTTYSARLHACWSPFGDLIAYRRLASMRLIGSHAFPTFFLGRGENIIATSNSLTHRSTDRLHYLSTCTRVFFFLNGCTRAPFTIDRPLACACVSHHHFRPVRCTYTIIYNGQLLKHTYYLC
jgi:hypothetical protein